MELSKIVAVLEQEAELTLDHTRMGDDAAALFFALFGQASCLVTAPQLLTSSVDSVLFQGVVTELFVGAPQAPAMRNIAVVVSIFDHGTNQAGEPVRHVVMQLHKPDLALSELLIRPDATDVIDHDDILSPNGFAIFKQLALHPATLIFSSFDYATASFTPADAAPAPYPPQFVAALAQTKVQRGLNFRLTGALEPAAFPQDTLPLPTDYTFFGAVTAPFMGNRLVLISDLATEFAQGDFAFALTALEIRCDIATLGRRLPEFELRGAITAGGIAASFTAGLDLAWMRCHFGFYDVALPSVAELAASLGVDDLAEHFPVPSAQLGSVVIQRCLLHLDLADAAFTALDLDVTVEHGMAFSDTIVLLPRLQLRVSAPFDKARRTSNALITGEWRMGAATLDLLMVVPDFSFAASLSIGSTLDVTALVQDLLGEIPLPATQLLDLDITGNFSHRQFEAEIALASDWLIEVGDTTLRLEQLWMELSYAQERVSRCQMTGRLRFADADFDILADYDPDEGWGLRGGSLPDVEISVTAWAHKLLAELGAVDLDIAAMPHEFADVALKHLLIEYRAAPQKIAFFAELGHPIALTDSFSIETTYAQFQLLDGKVVGAIGAHLILDYGHDHEDKIDLFLESEKREEGWAFAGESAPETPLPIGRLVKSLAARFGAIQLPTSIAAMTVSNLSVAYATATSDFAFTCEGHIPLSDTERVEITLVINLESRNGVYHHEFSGHLAVGGDGGTPLLFDLHFADDDGAAALIAAYSHPPGQGKLNPAHLLQGLVPSDAALLKLIPASLAIDLKDAFFAYLPTAAPRAASPSASGRFLFGLDLDAALTLSDLPLIGPGLSTDEQLGVDNLQLVLASGDFIASEIRRINQLLPSRVSKLPELASAQPDVVVAAGGAVELPAGSQSPVESAIALGHGVTLKLKIQFGDQTHTLALPISSATPPSPEPVDAGASAVPEDDVKWFVLQKRFGPAHFARIGLRYQESALWLLLDASLALAGLTLSLDGLGMHSKLDPLQPIFSLRGLGLDYKGGPVAIGGAFLRKPLPDPRDFEFDGLATIKTETLTLSALGSYAEMAGHTSLFVYAILDYPLGGPSFFFVTGLSAGFGYNRGLVMPDVSQVADFPLVKTARGGAAKVDADALPAVLASFDRYVPPKVGASFLAVGIKYTSFQLIDSFALMAVSFGDHFEVDLLGISAVVTPPPMAETDTEVTPLAEMELAVKARFAPEEGFLGVQAQLTANSYILSRNCTLTGGFAFFAWFNGPNAGEFALSLGGYHPAFSVPDHYPRVPRLAFNWKVDDHLAIKGSLYYALTAGTLMAGGALHAVWEKGGLKAVFDAGADFLIAWRPYHYDAHIYVHIAGSATFRLFGSHHIRAHVGADLHLWGPDLAGSATVDLSVTSLTVRFGTARPHLQPIDWPTFKASFLPQDVAVAAPEDIVAVAAPEDVVAVAAPEDVVADSTWLSITVVTGLLATVANPADGQKSIIIVNPKELSFATNSVIPIATVRFERGLSDTPPRADYARFGLAPMDLAADYVTSELTISITGGAGDLFQANPIYKKAPVALWGESCRPDLQGKQFIEHSLSGFELKPAATARGGESHPLDRDKLLNQITPLPAAFRFSAEQSFRPIPTSTPRAIVAEKLARNDQRDRLLAAAGFDPVHDVRLSPHAVADSLLTAPKIVRR